MPYDNNGLRNSTSSNSINQHENFPREIPYRRFTEGSSFRDRIRLVTDVKYNSSSDISPRSRRYPSLSDDFQDSIDFSIPPQRTMSFSGGSNSLPAFLSGPSEGGHSALLQQMQANQRAIENDYSEQPHCATLPVDILAASLHAGTRPHHPHHTGHHSRRHRHRSGHRDASGHRIEHESSSRTRHSRDEGTHPALRGAYLTTSAERRVGPNHHTDYDNPPPRPPLSRYHMEHRYPGRVLRVSSSLPTSLTYNPGDSILVPMAHNPTGHHSRHRSGRRRVPETVGHTRPRSQRGYSLTPPPVCRANKPTYDENNRLIQTVSSPSVVTHCVDSRNNSCRLQTQEVPTAVKTEQPKTVKTEPSAQEKSKLSQPTHVVISQQPRRKGKKKLVDDDDEISRQKKGLVVSLNNNVTKCPHSFVTVESKEEATTLSSISSKMSDESTLKREEASPMLASAGDSSRSEHISSETAGHEPSSRCQAKSGDPSHTCSRCGKCTCPQCRLPPGGEGEYHRTSHCWMCNHRCLCNVDSCVETATCLCCVRGLFYHCSNYEDDDTCADKPCSCTSEKCCVRWTVMGALSLCLPCLWCYPLARGCVKLCRTCSGDDKRGCQCKEDYR